MTGERKLNNCRLLWSRRLTAVKVVVSPRVEAFVGSVLLVASATVTTESVASFEVIDPVMNKPRAVEDRVSE